LAKIRGTGGLELPPIPKSIQPEGGKTKNPESPKKKKKKGYLISVVKSNQKTI